MQPLIALTMGDPSGIGPEIALKLFHMYRNLPCRIVIIGELEILENAQQFTKLQEPIHLIDSPEKATEIDTLYCISLHATTVKDSPIGTISAQSGRASYQYITTAIDYALKKQVDAVVTNPINKESLKKAGIHYPGHTEIFADQTNTQNYSMMFLLENVAVVHVTTHCSLREALDLISTKKVVTNIKLLNITLKRMGIHNPRIAVGGLNPHAGENGLFGREELDIINPAIVEAQYQNIKASGPYPPDTVFMRAFSGEFNGIVSMLHDHGFVALKSRNFEQGVNITIGLPIIRTSVGHGTAFDIAGTGMASPTSLHAAVTAAAQLVSKS